MPAAIAVPAIASVAGGAIGAVGQHLSQKSAQKAADKRIAQANMYAGQDYQRALDFQNQLMGGQGMPGQLFNQMIGPQTTTGSSTNYSNTVQDENSTQGLVKTPELLATRTRAAQAAGEIPSSLAGMLQNQFRQVANQEAAAKNAAWNRAAMTGASPQDVALATAIGPGAQQANQARLNALMGVNQELYNRQGQARAEQASIEQMLADQYRNAHMTSATRGGGTSTSTGPGNIGGALSLLAPVNRQVYV